jgi:mannose-6-phosphate isomerase
MRPVLLPSNQPRARFYAGGARIAEFRGQTESEPNTPEDWVASTTSVRGHEGIGQTRLPDGRLLVDVVAAAPELWLGPEHVAAYGADTKLLVKLLDAGQRLPIHAHPDRDAAAGLVHAHHGKAEAWYILTEGVVHLGLTRDVPTDEMLRLVREQHTDTLLSLMHRVEVKPHDTVYVPPGLLHAIGAGILLVELQEPEDLSILLEWKGFNLDGAVDGHLGVGFEAALTAVERRARTRDDILALVRRHDESSPLGPDADEYFRLAAVHEGPAGVRGFAVLVIVEGTWALESAAEPLALGRGDTLVLPYGAGAATLAGSGLALVAQPPL